MNVYTDKQWKCLKSTSISASKSTPKVTVKTKESYKAVGIGTDNPDASSILELKSENKGFLLPRINDINQINNAAEGLLVYNMKKNCVSIYTDKQWRCLKRNTPPIITGKLEFTDVCRRAIYGIVPAVYCYSSGKVITPNKIESTDEDGDDINYKYQWYRANDNKGSGETQIKGATNKNYEIQKIDVRHYIGVKVTPCDNLECGAEVSSEYINIIS